MTPVHHHPTPAKHHARAAANLRAALRTFARSPALHAWAASAVASLLLPPARVPPLALRRPRRMRPVGKGVGL